MRLLVTLIVFVLAKLWGSGAHTDDLRFLLGPVSELFGLATGDAGYWIPGQGYMHERSNILINGSCAGFSFFTVCFLTLMLARPRRRLQWYEPLVALLWAWPLTVSANTSRILWLSWWERATTPDLLTSAFMHQLQGGLIYLTFLAVIYLFVRYRPRPLIPSL